MIQLCCWYSKRKN